MKFEIKPPPPADWDECVLGLAIARAIQAARDERDAIRRICTLLAAWGIDMDPGELGSYVRK